MKSSVALLLFVGCGLVVSSPASESFAQEALNPAQEEPAIQQDISKDETPQLTEEKRNQKDIDNAPGVEDADEHGDPDDSMKKRSEQQLSSYSCAKLKSRHLCHNPIVARKCTKTCCSNYLSNLSCNRIKANGQCGRLFKHYCRRSCGACWINIHLKSEGCNDPGIKGCGHAYIFVNGHDYSYHRRGHNIVVLDNFGLLIKRGSFDTYADKGAGVKMRNFINAILWGRIVLIATQDSAERFIKPAEGALASLGAKLPFSFGFRGSWAFVGMKNKLNYQFKRQDGKTRHHGPTVINVKIPTPAV